MLVPERVTFTNLLFTDREERDFISVIVDPRTVLLTTALKQGIQSFLPLLARALTARVQRDTPTPLYIVACENAINSLDLRNMIIPLLPSEVIGPPFEQAVIFVPCMVDRICGKPFVNPLTNRVQVEVEQFAEWVLQRPNLGTPSLEEILINPETSSYIKFVPDLNPILRRKKWLVNGPHLLIALNAFAQRYTRLDIFLQEEPLARELLEGLLEEALEVFQAVEPSFGVYELREFNELTKVRFQSYPDRVARILSRFTGPERLHEFFQDFYGKVTKPALQYIELHRQEGEYIVPYWTVQTLLLVTQLINESRYVLINLLDP